MAQHQDNATAHTAATTAAFLAHAIPGRVLPWPTRSPDLSVVENAWAVLKDRVRASNPASLQQLQTVAKREWQRIVGDTAYVSALFGSIPKRLQMVCDAKGDTIAY